MIQKSFKNEKASLFLVATPIGNLDEMTYRAIKTLKQVDLIAAEDTRHTAKLLTYFEIENRMISYHNYNEKNSGQEILKTLSQGKDVALVSDAGYPLISDPGYWIVNAALDSGFNVTTVSGSSAFLNALVASGIGSEEFVFMGFLEKKESALRKQLKRVKEINMTSIFYLSVHQVEKTLEIMYDVLGNRPIVLARELTKKHEEYHRGLLLDIMARSKTLKGEFVLIIQADESTESVSIDELIEEVDALVAQGFKPSKSIAQIAKQQGVSKNDLYDAYHQKG